jgi:hypothetical protein
MPSGKFEEKGVVYTQLAHPRWFELACGGVLVLSAVVMIVALVSGFRRERRMLPLAPLGGFLITVWAWTIWSSIDPLVRYVIPALHSIQYFYFVWLVKRNEARAHEGPPSFGRPPSAVLGLLAAGALALGFVLFHAAPGLLDGALVTRPKRGATWDALGPTPYFAAFYVFVNVHHYFMDFVIWRRDNPDARYLALTR